VRGPIVLWICSILKSKTEILKKMHCGKRADKARKVLDFLQGPPASREMRWVTLGFILLVFLILKLQYNPYRVI
jgi:hypothetical protein